MSPEDAVDALSPEGRATPSAVPGDSVTVPPGDASGDANLRGGWIDFDFFSTTDLVDKEPRKNKLSKMALSIPAFCQIVSACRMQRRSNGFE